MQRHPLAKLRGRCRSLSLWGVAFCSTYALLIALCFAVAVLGNSDVKGRALFYQLPFALQSAVVFYAGLSEAFAWLPWLVQDVLLGLPMFIGLYLFGSEFDRRSRAE